MKAAALFLLALPLGAQMRIASDFEIQQMEQQIARSHDFVSLLSGHLNLGDLRLTRNESALARAEYAKAYQLAMNERLAARRASEMTRYATATSYAALTEAKLGDDATAFALSEEAIRYTSDSAKSWNLYSSTMNLLRRPEKSVRAAENAVAIAMREAQQSSTLGNRLDLAVYQYSLASSLVDSNRSGEAERILVDVVTSLRSNAFASLQSGVQRHESFEIYSSARGDESAYISLLNRSQLLLGRLYEERGNVAAARQQYQGVLAARVDDPIALAAMARLSGGTEERERYYADAFDANPFSLSLIRDYQHDLGERRTANGQIAGDSTGAQVRRALNQAASGELAAARSTLDALLQKFPDNDTLKLLRREIEQRAAGPVVLGPNRPLIEAFVDNRLTPEQRQQLDKMTFTSIAIFSGAPASGAPAPSPAPGQTIFETGTIDNVPFRFSEPIAFQGTFSANSPLCLTYRILGATRVGDADALLLEPLRLEAAR